LINKTDVMMHVGMNDVPNFRLVFCRRTGQAINQ